MSGFDFPVATDALRYLEYPERRQADDMTEEFLAALAQLKALSVERNDQAEASLCWQAETVADIQSIFVQTFQLLKEGRYYDAWCQLEQCEIAIKSLCRHYTASGGDLHRIRYVETMVERWQGLYPYRVFASPEFVNKKVTCSICGATVTPRSNCGHRKHGVYNGQLCLHRVEEMDFLSISIVQNPVQKYSVLFSQGEDGSEKDQYDYSLVKFAAERLLSPWTPWRGEATTRSLPRHEVAHISSHANCPCGSGDTFGSCCADKETVMIPHFQFAFGGPVRGDLPRSEFSL